MVEAIGWLTIAGIIMILAKELAKKIWPEDWDDDFHN